IASIGTPRGSSKSSARVGTFASWVVNRLLGCAHGSSRSSAVRSAISAPVQSRQPAPSGLVGVRPSHQTASVSSLYATLVNSVLVPGATEATPTGLVASLVSRATPNTPYSGLIA